MDSRCYPQQLEDPGYSRREKQFQKEAIKLLHYAAPGERTLIAEPRNSPAYTWDIPAEHPHAEG